MAKLRLRVQPGAKHDALLGFQEGVLRVKLAAPPIEGRANDALVAFLAGLLAVPKREIAIKSGLASRDKVVEILGLTSEEVAARLRRHLADY